MTIFTLFDKVFTVKQDQLTIKFVSKNNVQFFFLFLGVASDSQVQI